MYEKIRDFSVPVAILIAALLIRDGLMILASIIGNAIIHLPGYL